MEVELLRAEKQEALQQLQLQEKASEAELRREIAAARELERLRSVRVQVRFCSRTIAFLLFLFSFSVELRFSTVRFFLSSPETRC